MLAQKEGKWFIFSGKARKNEPLLLLFARKASEKRKKHFLLCTEINFALRKEKQSLYDNIFYFDELRKDDFGILPSFGNFVCDGAICSLASQNHQHFITAKKETGIDFGLF